MNGVIGNGVIGNKVKPSLWWCLLGLPFFLAGLGGFLYFLIGGITQLTDDMVQMTAPGSSEFTFASGETYTIFLEMRSTFEGKVYDTTESIEGLACGVASSDGSTILVTTAAADMNYSLGGRSGRSIFQFTVPHGGRYRLDCNYGGADGPRVVLAVGADMGKRISGPVLKSLASGLGGGLTGIAIVLTVVVLHFRSRNKRAQTV